MFSFTCSPPFWILTLTSFHHLLEPFPYNLYHLHPDRLFRLRLWLEFWRPAGQKTRSRPKSSKEAGCKSCRHSRCATVNAQPHDKVDKCHLRILTTFEIFRPTEQEARPSVLVDKREYYQSIVIHKTGCLVNLVWCISGDNCLVPIWWSLCPSLDLKI